MMTEAKIHRIRYSWGRIVAYREKAGQVFYGKLFALAPDLRPLFEQNVEVQNKKLILAVTVIVSKLNKLENLEQEMHWLGRMHRGFDLQALHFELFSKSFLEMLRVISRDLWDEATEEAWQELLEIISQAMLKELTQSTV